MGTELGSRAECPVLEFEWELSWELCFKPGLRAELGVMF